MSEYWSGPVQCNKKMQFTLMDKSLTLMLDLLSCLFEQFFIRYLQLKPSISYDPVFSQLAHVS